MLADCFTEDAVVTYPSGKRVEGRDNLIEEFQSMRAKRAGQSRHLITDVVVLSENESEADVVSCVASFSGDSSGSNVHRTGWYRDRMVREDDGVWRFRERIVGADDGNPHSAPLTAR
jgi:ketosteroid isomerase-like protein